MQWLHLKWNWNKTEIKQTQNNVLFQWNCFVSVLFQFYFRCNHCLRLRNLLSNLDVPIPLCFPNTCLQPTSHSTKTGADSAYFWCLLLHRPGRGAEYCDQPVCLCVCVSVCQRPYPRNRWTDRHEILYADPLWPWLGPPPAAFRYVTYFRFYGWRHVWP